MSNLTQIRRLKNSAVSPIQPWRAGITEYRNANPDAVRTYGETPLPPTIGDPSLDWFAGLIRWIDHL